MITPLELQPTTQAGRVKMVRVTGSARKQIVFRLVDGDGKPVDLTKEVDNGVAAPQFQGQRPVNQLNVVVRLRAKADLISQDVAFDLVGSVSPTDTSTVIFELGGDCTQVPGVYLAEIGQFIGPQLIFSWPCYVCVEPSVFQTLQGNGPLTMAEIRMALTDLESSEVSLLDDVEFSDVQIAHAMRRAVDQWNDTPPTIQYYTTADFPYRHYWTIGTVAHLLDMAAAKYRRNRLSYSAGGVSIDDQNKSTEYQAIADQKQQEYNNWMMREKIRLNMEASWATI